MKYYLLNKNRFPLYGGTGEITELAFSRLAKLPSNKIEEKEDGFAIISPFLSADEAKAEKSNNHRKVLFLYEKYKDIDKVCEKLGITAQAVKGIIGHIKSEVQGIIRDKPPARLASRKVLNKKQKIFMRDMGKCVYCESNLTLDNMTLDHVYPQSLGGSHQDDNLVCCCEPCNKRKKHQIWVF